MGLSRIDIKRTALSAETKNNWMPRVLGSMMLRPGMGYIGQTLSNAAAKYFPFIFSITDTALIEFTDSNMRIWIDDELVTRESVSTAVANGSFTTNLTSWTDSDESGATSSWVSPGYMQLVGDGTAAAIREQQLTVAAGDLNVEHAIRIVIARGPVIFKAGSTSGGSDYISETVLQTGTHSLAVTPTTDIYIRFYSRQIPKVWVDSCSIEAAGAMTLPTPWLAADLNNIRVEESADVVFVACAGYQQRRIERRAARSWSVVLYLTEDGPFRVENTGPITITPSAINGNITLTASASLFRSTQVGALFSIGSIGQEVTASISTQNTFTDYIRVTGVGTTRAFAVVTTGVSANVRTITNVELTSNVATITTSAVHGYVTGQSAVVAATTTTDLNGTHTITGTPTTTTFTYALTHGDIASTADTGSVTVAETITLQQSIGEPGSWVDVETWTANTTENYNDELDNQIIYYRIGIKTLQYGTGTAVCTLTYGSGTINGIVRITDFTNSTTVGAEVITALGSTAATDTWAEGQWSDFRGWPTSVALFEGRLWWAGKSGVWGSISDTYDGFDQDFEGDAAPINRTIGSGPVDTINWILPLQRMIIGGPAAEFSCRSSSLDEPLTVTNFNIRKASTQGSSTVSAAVIDLTGVFVQRGGSRVFMLEFNSQSNSYEYGATHLTELIPNIGSPGIVRIAVQRQPDTRLHCVRSDGVVAVMVFDKAENVNCWLTVTTDGLIEDVVVMPSASGEQDDYVYYVVKRTINGSTVRTLEKWAQESECRGDGQLCKLADSFVTYTGVATTSITGLSHLEGEEVVVWADGADVGTDDSVTPWSQRYTVSGGAITLATAASNVVVGLPYTAQFKSSKLGESVPGSSPLNQHKRINHLGLILADTHTKGLKFGPDFDNLDDMPTIERGTNVGSTVVTNYDEDMIEFPGVWDTDLRLCLQAQAPRPCTVLSASIPMEAYD